MSKMHSIKYGNKKISFKIERSNRRKTVGIRIDSGKGVVVRTPHLLSDDEIAEIVGKKARWIVEKLDLVKNHSHFHPIKEFVSGETFLYLGKQYRLKVIKSDSENGEKCKLISGRLQVEINKKLHGNNGKEAVKKALVRWYFEHAEDKIPERVKLYARLIGAWPQRIEIKNNKRRWGSCSQNGVVRFNWKIIMAPVTILDYVIVHELCHLVYPNHSSQFWEKVQTIIPDCKTRRNRLKEYSLHIRIFN
jgi:predicted metal-dependent hydrolase